MMSGKYVFSQFFVLTGALWGFEAQAQMSPASPTPIAVPDFYIQGASQSVQWIGSTGGGPTDANCSVLPTTAPADGGPGGPGGGLGSPTTTTNGVTTDTISYDPLSFSASSPSYATGIVVNSIGGTGGPGGDGATCYGGRSGGAGGVGGSIYLSYSGTLNLTGSSSYGSGIIVISQGGQGGNGGSTGADGLNGGNGGAGGNGGTINVVNNGTISTSGSYAFGMYGLSIGGGGGAGGTSNGAFSGSGGAGMAGGDGGSVSITNNVSITTANAYGMLAMSVGGYGGLAGASDGFVPYQRSSGNPGYGGNGGDVSLTNTGSVTTTGDAQIGMEAISVGGGGGDGGQAYAFAALGASGGTAGNGGNVSVTNSGSVQTGAYSPGIVALSIGGGGGSGGLAAGGAILGGSGTAGSGGGGGAGGAVTVENTGSVCTGGACGALAASSTGSLAPAIVALSVGGGGGVGGAGYGGGLVSGVAVGGKGGNGGNGGQVWVTNSGTLQTTEVASAGIVAASVGGGGGHSGGAFSVQSGFAGLAVALGGSGGDGGASGTVGVNCNLNGSQGSSNTACSSTTSNVSVPAATTAASGAAIQTQNDFSPGIMALSIGGGGGTGGYAVSLSADVATSNAVSIGGKGGSGGAGGAVYANTAGVNIVTNGELSPGILALSVGGGGGHGGVTFYSPDYLPDGTVASQSATISIGGTGGSGGAGGAVVAENMGADITISGDHSSGITALSVGGGGGHGGLAAGGALAFGFAVSASVGGSGGSGGNGGDVSVYNTSMSKTAPASITTYGADSHAIEAISVGGSGGSGGWSVAASNAPLSASSFSIGGTGAAGGSSGAVAVTNSGALAVYGRGGAGILALSIAGGGGNGGSSAAGDVSFIADFTEAVGGQGAGGGTGGAVTVTNNGAIYTGVSTATSPTDPARASQGIVAMSVGGGGGRGGIAVAGDVTALGSFTSALGGGGASGGTGGAVTVTNNAKISSFGDFSNAITAISIGGAGGMGGIAASADVAAFGAVNVALGGNGGSGGTGGDVSVTNSGTIYSGGFPVPLSTGGTIVVGGYRANGILAQSMGGRGGVGGIAVGANISASTGLAPTSVTLGGSGGGGGVAGSATIANTGSVTTNGPFAAALIAQSLGGDGGVGGIGIGTSLQVQAMPNVTPSVTLGGNGGKASAGGAASITSSGSVTTQGLNSIGILSQSIGGSGGLSGITLSAVSINDSTATTNVVMQHGDVGGAATGGAGGAGGAASANVTGTVSTSGLSLSTGIAVESIGGGGGRSGATFDLSGSITSVSPLNYTASSTTATLGSSGGAGGDGGTATLTQSGVVKTTGVMSDALYAGSIGGGGGSSGLGFVNMTLGTKTFDFLAGGVAGAVGNGGAVTVSANANQAASTSYAISSNADFSHGLFAQSVGGGGGNLVGAHIQSSAGGLFQALHELGATGASGGDGGAVTVTTGGQIEVTGYGSQGVMAQSIGGGGGQTLSAMIGLKSTLSIPGAPIQFTVGSGSASAPNGSAGTSTTAPSATVALPGSNTVQTSTTAGSAGAMSLGGFSTSAGNGGAVIVNSGTSSNAGTITTTGWLSDAVKAQSIGGGGGFSGVADLMSGSPFAGGTMFLGGGGSGGGSGGEVTVTNYSTIATSGPLSAGILAQSIGGGGGDGRLVSSAAAAGLTSGFTFGQGALAGATGGSGRAVTVTNYGNITTTGVGSDDIVAQSIGGGGGFSGFYGGGQSAPTFATGSALQGNALAGSLAGQSSSSSSNSAFAGYDNSNTAGGSVGTMAGQSLAAVLGAAGGSSNNGGVVNVTTSGALSTGGTTGTGAGDGSIAVLAQSIGAGGGIVRHHTVNFDQSQTSMSMLLGGIGSASGGGSNVSISSSSDISTTGRGALGLLGQSIGGGGGLGMLTEATVGQGGSASLALVLGGVASSSGIVNVTNNGTITTTGAQAQGLVAQSIANGGGVAKAAFYAASAGVAGGSDTNATVYNSGASAMTGGGLAIAAQLGSPIGETKDATSGAVAVLSQGTISTSGVRATGIIAQAIGGGGGVVDITAAGLNGGALAAQVVLGGNALNTSGLDIAGGVVGVTTGQAGIVNTAGSFADGILAQSISGGGGSFGLSHVATGTAGVGWLNFTLGSAVTGGTETVTGNQVAVITNGTIATKGYGSTGITAQSIAGGGGVLAYNLSSQTLTQNFQGYMGGAFSQSTFAGNVGVTTGAAISTSGDYGTGILAQSIAGGGGRVVGNASASGQVVLGVQNGAPALSGAVVVQNNAQVTTTGFYAHGIVAQSIGGGGGVLDTPISSVILGAASNTSGISAGDLGDAVGVTVDGAISVKSGVGVVAQSIGGGGGLAIAASNIVFGSQSNNASAGSDVAVTVNSAVSTAGAASPGVLAMSVGGGGGAVINTLSTAPTVSTNNGSGAGGSVTVNVNSAIITTGAGSDGVVAASIGGGGGLVISSTGAQKFGGLGTGAAGVVTVNVNTGGGVAASGSGATGVYAVQAGAGSDPTVNIGLGAFVLGGRGGRGVHFGGAVNNLNNAGYVGTFDGVNGLAVSSENGDTTINNTGQIVGSLRLSGGGANVFNNLQGGAYLAGPSIDLGGGVLANSGVIRPMAGVTTLTGDLRHLAGGVIQIAMQQGGGDEAQINVTGNAALGGRIQELLPTSGPIAERRFSPLTIIANGSMSRAGLSFDNTALMTRNLVADGRKIRLDTVIEYSPLGLSRNGGRFGEALAAFERYRSTPLMDALVRRLLTIPDVGSVDRVYAQLGGSPVSAILQTGIQTAQAGMNSFAEQADRWRAGGPRAADKRWQSWISPYGGFANLSSHDGNLSTQFYGGSAGADYQLTDNTLLGFGVVGGQNQIRVSSASMYAMQTVGGGGVYGMARFGQAYVSGAAYGGADRAWVMRSFGGFGTGNVSLGGTVAGARVEAGYTVPMGLFTLTPFIAFEPTGRWQNGANETLTFAGLQENGLAFHSKFTGSLPLLTGAQVDHNFKLPDGTALMAFLRAGWMHEFSANRDLTKDLGGLSMASFTTGGDYAVRNLATIHAGLKHRLSEQVSVFADVNSQIYGRGASLGGQAGLQIHW